MEMTILHTFYFTILSLKYYFFFNNKNNNFSNLFLISAFVFMNKVSMIFVMILPIFFLKRIDKKQTLNYKNYFTILFILFWIIKNLLISGCLIYFKNMY